MLEISLGSKNIVCFKMQNLQEEFNHSDNREYFDCFLSFLNNYLGTS